MDEKIVTVAQFADYIEANLAKQILEGAGIKALVSGENTSTLFAGLPGFSEIATIELQVFESQADQAKEILQSAEPLDEQADEEADQLPDEPLDEPEDD